ncbi:MSHA biogenesis protein MshO [Marinobacter sp. LV10R520-4]|uniref:PilW family protein n=1 Tax=Marinobacter sp. LV10R520-4 TaxID=1761796 RepID=UPI000BF38528|nr:type II secretion system protein [Marinobacter sp. LV10R520-4]PFG52113.1 MSHA biogenesis protein MshO [Marinobacter sp. LV10R520-4]
MLSLLRNPGRSVRCQAGFTLVEMVMVIVLASVIVVMITTVMSRPLQGFVDQIRRAELVDLAASALNRMTRDIRLAVPNSLRVVGSTRLELLRSPSGGRYRASPVDGEGVRRDPPACTADPCVVEVLSPMIGIEDLDEFNWMVIYNIGGKADGDNIWPPLNNAILANGTAISVISPKVTVRYTQGKLSLSDGGVENFQFKYASPQHRFFLADKVVGYQCSGGQIVRGEFDSLELPGAYDYSRATPVVDHVDCANSGFTYSPDTHMRSSLVTVKLTLSQDGETITLLQQVHVDNAP